MQDLIFLSGTFKCELYISLHADWFLFFSSLNPCCEYSEIRISVYPFCRLLMGKGEPVSLVQELDTLLDQLGSFEDNVAFNFVNSLENLLWAFERRATASWVFQLAIRKSIYRHDVFRYSAMTYFTQSKSLL